MFDESKIYLRKLRAARVAQFALQQRLEKIDWEERTLFPELEAEKNRTSSIEFPTIPVIEIEHEDHFAE